MAQEQIQISLDAAKIFIILPIRCRLGEFSRHLADTTVAAATNLLSAQPGKTREEDAAWEEKRLTLPTDLHSTLVNVLGHRKPTGDKPVFWSINKQLLKALNQRADGRERDTATPMENRDNYGLALRLNDAAANRLVRGDDDRFVPLKISTVEFYLSQSRFGQMVVEIECGGSDVDAATLIEVAYALGHGRYAPSKAGHQLLFKLSFQNEPLWTANAARSEGAFSLSDLAVALLSPDGRGRDIVQAPRNFTYTLAGACGALSEDRQKELAARLARRLNSAYSPRASMEGVEFASPFDNIVHACSLDGGAALVTKFGESEYLKALVQNQGTNTYLKLALLAHKEMHDLVALSQGTATTIEHSERADEAALKGKLKQIEQINERLLNYRLAHRFSLAGFSVNHNLVHSAWRRAIHADTLLEDVTNDVSQASDYLRSTQERIRDKALQAQTSWLKAFLAFLGTLEGMHVLMTLGAEWWGLPTPQQTAIRELASAFGKPIAETPTNVEQSFLLFGTPFLIALIVAVAVFWFSQREGER